MTALIVAFIVGLVVATALLAGVAESVFADAHTGGATRELVEHITNHSITKR